MFQNPADGFCAERAHGPSGCAKRRRQRRLRSWLRHERQTVALELAVALHHSRDVMWSLGRTPAYGHRRRKLRGGGGSRVALCPTGPKQPPPGERPGILAEPGPQRSDRSRRHSSGDDLLTPSLPVLAGASGEEMDSSTLRFLTAMALRDQRQQRIQQLREEIQESESRLTRRKKKRKKKKLPRGRFFRCRARRQQRQWHVSGSPGVVLLRAAFPSVVGRPEMPCIMAGMDQKDRCSGMYKVGIAGDSALRAVFVSLVGRPRMLVILADIDQKDSCSSMFKAGISGYNAPRAVFSSLVRRPMTLGIMAFMDQKGQWQCHLLCWFCW